MEYGLQLYSIRDITGNDLEGALKQVADLGYKFVEFAGFFGHSAEEVKGWLDKYGLICSGTHTGWGDLLPENIEATIAYHKTIGNPHIIIPGADLGTLEKIIDFCAVMNKAQLRLAKEGISLGYHNHSQEFFMDEGKFLLEHERDFRKRIEVAKQHLDTAIVIKVLDHRDGLVNRLRSTRQCSIARIDSYAAITIQKRYSICLNLSVFSFFILVKHILPVILMCFKMG